MMIHPPTHYNPPPTLHTVDAIYYYVDSRWI